MRWPVSGLALAALLALVLSGCSGAAAPASGTAPAQASLSSLANASPGSPLRVSDTPAPTPKIDSLVESSINRIGPSVVEVTTNKGLGSGVILTSNGYTVTNHHVVAGASTIRVTLANGTKLPATIAGIDASDDLAVIRVHPSSKLPVATLGNSSALIVGQTVLAMGNPLAYTHVVTEGIVSALNRTVLESQGSSAEIRNAIETSAPINPGNSGGALFDLAGQVVGIPTLTAVDPEFNAPASGIGFAIPSNTVASIAEQIIKTGKVEHTGRAALGVGVVPVTPALASQYRLPVNHGVLVAQVIDNHAAAKAGLKQGDVIVKFDGKSITGEGDLNDDLAAHAPGDKVTLTVVTSNGNRKTYQVTLGEFPASGNF
ncbi:MAG: S1C family serine protease [Chloroflexota bacterium]